MQIFGVSLGSFATLVLAANLSAQSTAPTWVTEILPPNAKIIETANVNTGGRVGRILVLWMLDPHRVVRREVGGGGCSDWVYGDHWYGPARLSLLNSTTRKIINTIEIHGMYEGAQDPEHGFPIPFLVRNGSYYVPQAEKIPEVKSGKEGVPKLLNLRDLTGEGVAGQFVLFEYEACAISLTTVVGYSPHTDRAVQFEVETPLDGGRRTVTSWVEQVFAYPPSPPGRWDFTWEPGHGADGSVHERVSFDRTRQLFVRK